MARTIRYPSASRLGPEMSPFVNELSLDYWPTHPKARRCYPDGFSPAAETQAGGDWTRWTWPAEYAVSPDAGDVDAGSDFSWDDPEANG